MRLKLNPLYLQYVCISMLLFLFVNVLISKDLPPNFPPFDIKTLNNPSSGAMLFATRGNGYGMYLIVTDSAANVINYKPVTGVTSNFSVQPNGQLTFNTVVQGYFKAYSEAKFYIADTELNIIDSIVSGNDFVPAPHVSEILPNGNYLYSSFEAHHIDMSKIVENGNPNSIVAGAVLVEMDIDKNVVFQWRSWDYINIEDTYQPIDDFLNVTTLYSNFNSVATDTDGNYLISNRLLSEIIKVNRVSGEIMWRLGGKHNEFTFLGDNQDYAPFYFSMQHDVRILPNGNILLFDNGDQHNPPSSRGVEYKIDESAKTATLVWDYKPEINIFSSSNGSIQRTKTGNTLIGWGNTVGNPIKIDITEVNSDNKIEFEMSLPKNINAFKSIKFPYPIGKEAAIVTKDELLPLNTYKFDNNFGKTGVTTVFSDIEGFMYNSITVSKFNYAPLYPRFEGSTPIVAPYKYIFDSFGFDKLECEVRFDITGMEWMISPEKFIVYVRKDEKSGIFSPLETTFDTKSNQLIAKTKILGEFIFAKNYNFLKPEKPFLITPANNSILLNNQSIKFSWSPKGYFRKSKIQIAEDSNFIKILIDTTNIIHTQLLISELPNDKNYYWRAAAYNDTEIGEWSDTFTFSTSKYFVNITEPNGGEIWKIDTNRKFVRWEKNFNSPVTIELLLNDEVVYSIIDSLVSYTGAFAFKLPQSTLESDKYKIRVKGKFDSDVSTESDNYFTISNPVVGVKDYLQNSLSIKNYPNPFSNITKFEFNSNESGYADISIFSSNGKNLVTIFGQFVNSGLNSFEWKNNILESGNYIYRLTLNGQSISDKLIIIK